MESQQPKNKIESLFENTSNYVDTRLELAKLKAVKKSSETIANIGTKVIVAAIFFFFLLMLNIGLAFLLGDVLGKNYYGFLIVALFYFFVGLIVYSNKDKWVKIFITNSIIKQLNN